MTRPGRPSSTQLFTDSMKEREGIADAFKHYGMEGLLPSERDKFTEKLAGYALDEAKKNKKEAAELAKKGIKKGKDLIAHADYGLNYIEAKAQKGLRLASEQATRWFTGGLEEIIKDSKDKILSLPSKKLADGTAVDDLLYQAAGKDFQDWHKVYSAVEGAKQLYAAAKGGRIDDDQRKALVAPAAQLAAQEERKRLKDLGHSIVEQERGAQEALMAVFAGHRGSNYAVEGAQELVKQSEEALKKYEKDNKGKNLKAYITAGLSGMSKGKLGWENSLVARDMLYNAIR